jgi:hypothetical protein
MAARRTPQPLRTGGKAWGPERVRLGLSLDRLSELSGVPASLLSLAEHGRLVPTGDEFTAVMRALAEADKSGQPTPAA